MRILLSFALLGVCVSASQADDIVKLQATDLAAQTHKWDGKIIETTLSCFFADVSEYRCVGERVRIDFTSLRDEQARERVEKDCDTITKSAKRQCKFTLQFVYDSFDQMENGSGGKMTVVLPKDGEGTIVSKRK